MPELSGPLYRMLDCLINFRCWSLDKKNAQEEKSFALPPEQKAVVILELFVALTLFPMTRAAQMTLRALVQRNVVRRVHKLVVERLAVIQATSVVTLVLAALLATFVVVRMAVVLMARRVAVNSVALPGRSVRGANVYLEFRHPTTHPTRLRILQLLRIIQPRLNLQPQNLLNRVIQSL